MLRSGACAIALLTVAVLAVVGAVAAQQPIPPVDFRPFIRDIPDFPKPGILFKDITPLLADPTAFRASVERLAERY